MTMIRSSSSLLHRSARRFASRAVHRLLLALLVAGGLALVPAPSPAATPNAILFADRDVDEALSQVLGRLASEVRRVEIGAAAADAACAAAPGKTPRLALVSSPLQPAYLDACGRGANARVLTVLLGYQAIALVAPARTPIWPITSAALFRALTDHPEAPRRPAVWSELDPTYPRLPIGVLLAPSGSTDDRLFEALVLTPPCSAVADEKLPLRLGNRIRYCSAMRSDLPAVRHSSGARDLTAWAASAPLGQLAVVRLAELRRLQGLVVPLPLDGQLPTAAYIASGRYAAAATVELLVVVPRGGNNAERAETWKMAFDLLAETSIGPEGTLVAAGLIPLPPAQRVASRSEALDFFRQ
jgi:phosphate transport system substrate-binding protein